MHILVIPSWYPSNPEDITASFIREQAQALVRYGGHKVGVIFPLSNPRPWSCGLSRFSDVEILREEGVSTYRSQALNWFRRIPYLSSETWIREGMRLYARYMKECGKPEVIHAHVMFYGGLLARRIAEKYRIPFVITEHNSGYVRGFVKPWQLALGKRAVRSASRCIAVGEQFAGLLDQVYNLPSGNWQYIPNLISMPFFEAPLIVRHKSKRSSFLFSTICNLNANKGVDLLIRAFALSFRGQRDIRLSIGGEGPERETLDRLVKSVGLSEQVRFLGKLDRDQVVDAVSQSDAFVLSSHYETFGVALAEALALGKPVVATRCGGPESIVLPNAGLLVEKNNEKALADAMRVLFKQASDFDARTIRESCLSRFSAPIVIKRLTAIYKEIKFYRHRHTAEVMG